MKFYFLIILIFLILAIIQFSILPFFAPKGLFPNLILILCFCLAVLLDKHKTLIFAWISALTFFIFTDYNLIFIISGFIFISLALNLSYKRFFHNFKIFTGILFVLIGVLFFRIMLISFNYYFLNWRMFLPEAGYSLIFSLLVFAIFAKLKTNNVSKF